jgi:hypothetical protein
MRLAMMAYSREVSGIRRDRTMLLIASTRHASNFTPAAMNNLRSSEETRGIFVSQILKVEISGDDEPANGGREHDEVLRWCDDLLTEHSSAEAGTRNESYKILS